MLDKIKDIIEKLVEKITGDDRLFENFKSNPIETVKKLIHVLIKLAVKA